MAIYRWQAVTTRSVALSADSDNFTRAAEEHNAENMLVIGDPQLAEQYTANWYRHAYHSVAYRRGDTFSPSGRSHGSAGGYPSHHAEKPRASW